MRVDDLQAQLQAQAAETRSQLQAQAAETRAEMANIRVR